MSRRLLNFVRRSRVLVLVAVLVLAEVGTSIAQNPNSTSAMLIQILKIVSKSEVNYRVTPAVVILGGLTICTVVNVQPDVGVIAEPRVISVSLVDRVGMFLIVPEKVTVDRGAFKTGQRAIGNTMGTLLVHCGEWN